MKSVNIINSLMIVIAGLQHYTGKLQQISSNKSKYQFRTFFGVSDFISARAYNYWMTLLVMTLKVITAVANLFNERTEYWGPKDWVTRPEGLRESKDGRGSQRNYVQVFAIANLSVCLSPVCNVRAPYWGLNLSAIFLHCCVHILWPSCKILRR